MDYLLSFSEGIITFISPCLLPMLPMYISYFAGQPGQRRKPVVGALGFVLGFTLVFVSLGAFAGTIGYFLRHYNVAVNLVSGGIVIFFGLNYLGIFNIPLLSRTLRMDDSRVGAKGVTFFSAMLFGIVFSIGWTPCVGAFLGSALMLAAGSGDSFRGILMLLCFSIGLGIPFVASALLIDRLQSTFAFIKRNYRVINKLSGALLVVIGILMATGMMGYFLSLLTF